MCQKKSTLHSCGHTGPVTTDICPDAALHVDQSLNKEAAIFMAACNVSTKTEDRDYCCSRKCCSQQIQGTYETYCEAGAAKADFPDPGFWQRSISGKPRPSYLTKKEEVKEAYLKAQSDHNGAKEKHGMCRRRQDAASEYRRAATDEGKRPVVPLESGEKLYHSRQEREQQKTLEREVRKRFGEVPEPNERKDSRFPEISRRVDTGFPDTSARRRPPPPPPITSYGAPRNDHEYVQEWLPRIKPGMPSEGSRSRPSSYLALGPPASAAFATQSHCTHCGQCTPPAKITGDDPFADEYAAPVGDRMKKA